MEDYAAKMARKPLDELRRYLSHWSEYHEGAVVAALDELEKRGETLPADLMPLRERLRLDAHRIAEQERAAAAQRAADARHAASMPEEGEGFSLFGPSPHHEADRSGPAPAPRLDAPLAGETWLYSPTVILLFSFLFSFITGGVLLALNLRQVRQFAGAWLVGAFCVAYGVVLYSLQGRLGAVGSFMNLPAALVFNLVFWPRYIGFGRSFQPRNFLWPLLICLALSAASIWWLWSQGMLPLNGFSPLPPRPATP